MIMQTPFVILFAFILWCTFLGFIVIFVALFALEFRREKKEFSLLLCLFYLFLGIGRLFHMTIDFTIGYPEDSISFTGPLLILHIIYSIFSLIALFMFFFAIERKLEKNTHYLFSILVVITAILTITNYFLPEEISFPFFTFVFVYPVWILTILSLPLLYLNVAIHSEGSIRKKAIITVIGMITFEFGIAINSPEARPVFQLLGSDLILLIPPIFQIVGAILVYIAFRSKK